MSGVSPYSPEMRAAAVADYATGMTMDEVAAKHGASATSVWNWLKAANVPCRPAATVKRAPCNFEDCGAPHHAHGYCELHYQRVHLGRKPRTLTTADRLEDIRWMAECGESLTGAAERLGLSRQGLLTWIAQKDRATADLMLAQDVLMPESRAGLRVSA